MSGTTITCKPDTNSYTMAQRMLDAAICAYAVTPHGFHPNCKYWAPIKSTGTAMPMQGGSSFIDACYLTVTDDNWVVVAIRGTLSGWNSWDSFVAFIKDWLNDDKTKPTPMYAGGRFLGNVHKGFLESTYDLWSMLAPQLKAIDWSTMQGLQITGHSKGAGMCFPMAALAKLELAGAKGGGPKTIEVNAYAAPLAGDPIFASSYNSLGLDGTTIRHQRAHDVVPFLPSYVSWDIFKHITWEFSRPESLAIYIALEALGKEIYGGYELVGSPVFYPGVDPVGWTAVIGSAAITQSRAAIQAAVKYGDGDMIADAHSAAHSYWPALFQQPNPVATVEELEAEFMAELECGVEG